MLSSTEAVLLNYRWQDHKMLRPLGVQLLENL